MDKCLGTLIPIDSPGRYLLRIQDATWITDNFGNILYRFE